MSRLPSSGALSLVLVLLAGTAAGEDRANVDRTQIIGNRELPKVLYIVPWKQPGPGELAAHPLHSVLDEALAPLDRDVFRRQVAYHGSIEAAARDAAAAATPVQPAAPPPARN